MGLSLKAAKKEESANANERMDSLPLVGSILEGLAEPSQSEFYYEAKD